MFSVWICLWNGYTVRLIFIVKEFDYFILIAYSNDIFRQNGNLGTKCKCSLKCEIKIICLNVARPISVRILEKSNCMWEEEAKSWVICIGFFARSFQNSKKTIHKKFV